MLRRSASLEFRHQSGYRLSNCLQSRLYSLPMCGWTCVIKGNDPHIRKKAPPAQVRFGSERVANAQLGWAWQSFGDYHQSTLPTGWGCTLRWLPIPCLHMIDSIDRVLPSTRGLLVQRSRKGWSALAKLSQDTIYFAKPNWIQMSTILVLNSTVRILFQDMPGLIFFRKSDESAPWTESVHNLSGSPK